VRTLEQKKKTQRNLGLATVPRVARLRLRAFRAYLRRYVSRHFHAVRVNWEQGQSVPPEMPLIVYANHSSWWDPLVGLLLAERYFPEHTFYAPVDAEAVKKYRFFETLGFFGIEQQTSRGAADFLSTAQAILSARGGSLWVTPEGRFVDPRADDAGFEPGLAHLASRLERGRIVPLALEYPFWEDRLPEALIRAGEPIEVEAFGHLEKPGWQELLTLSLRETQRELAELAVSRQHEQFETMLRGGVGVGGSYDLWRRIKSWATGQSIPLEHGRHAP